MSETITDPDLQHALSVAAASRMTDADKAKVSELLTLTAKSAAGMTGAELRRARELAGLSVGQAVNILGMSRPTVLWLESDDPAAAASRRDAGKLLDEVYGLDCANRRRDD